MRSKPGHQLDAVGAAPTSCWRPFCSRFETLDSGGIIAFSNGAQYSCRANLPVKDWIQITEIPAEALIKEGDQTRPKWNGGRGSTNQNYVPANANTNTACRIGGGNEIRYAPPEAAILALWDRERGLPIGSGKFLADPASARRVPFLPYSFGRDAQAICTQGCAADGENPGA